MTYISGRREQGILDKQNNVNKGREVRRMVVHLRKGTRSILNRVDTSYREAMGKKSYGEGEKGLNSGTYGMIGKGTHLGKSGSFLGRN